MVDHKQNIFDWAKAEADRNRLPYPQAKLALPEADADLRAMVDATREEALCLVPIVPPPAEGNPTSFLGGRPFVSSGFAWPKGSAAGAPARPNSFIAQIDCGNIPDLAGRDLLPRSGRLCFFLDWNINEKHLPASEHKGLVVHDTGQASQEAALPMDLPWCHDTGAGHYYPWLKAVGKYPKTLTKWPIALHALRTYVDESYADPYGGSVMRWRTTVDDLMQAQFLAMLGTPPERHWKAQPNGELFRPTAGFPEYWVHIQIFLGQLIPQVEKGINGLGRPGDPWPQDPATFRAIYEPMLEQARQKLMDARAHEPFEPVSPQDRAALLNWCHALNSAVGPDPKAAVYDQRSYYQINQAINGAYIYGADLCISQGGPIAAALDDEALEWVRAKRAPLVGGREIMMSWHQMLGHGANVQSAAQMARGHKVLLAQFASEGASAWQWGDMGALQYWIDKADLRAGRFDRVTLTADSH